LPIDGRLAIIIKSAGRKPEVNLSKSVNPVNALVIGGSEVYSYSMLSVTNFNI
jgi:hypothetical protein